jgi:hypothetical protein
VDDIRRLTGKRGVAHHVDPRGHGAAQRQPLVRRRIEGDGVQRRNRKRPDRDDLRFGRDDFRFAGGRRLKRRQVPRRDVDVVDAPSDERLAELE